jgi:hypothetical protein
MTKPCPLHISNNGLLMNPEASTECKVLYRATSDLEMSAYEDNISNNSSCTVKLVSKNTDVRAYSKKMKQCTHSK